MSESKTETLSDGKNLEYFSLSLGKNSLWGITALQGPPKGQRLEIHPSNERFAVKQPQTFNPQDMKEVGKFSMMIGIVKIQGCSFLLMAEKVRLCGFLKQYWIYEIKTIEYFLLDEKAEFTPEVKEDLFSVIEYYSTSQFFSFGYNLTQTWDARMSTKINFCSNYNLQLYLGEEHSKNWITSTFRGYAKTIIQTNKPNMPEVTLLIREASERTLIEICIIFWKKGEYTKLLRFYLSNCSPDEFGVRVSDQLIQHKKVAVFNTVREDSSVTRRTVNFIDDLKKETSDVIFRQFKPVSGAFPEEIFADDKESSAIARFIQRFSNSLMEADDITFPPLKGVLYIIYRQILSDGCYAILHNTINHCIKHSLVELGAIPTNKAEMSNEELESTILPNYKRLIQSFFRKLAFLTTGCEENFILSYMRGDFEKKKSVEKPPKTFDFDDIDFLGNGNTKSSEHKNNKLDGEVNLLDLESSEDKKSDLKTKHSQHDLLEIFSDAVDNSSNTGNQNKLNLYFEKIEEEKPSQIFDKLEELFDPKPANKSQNLISPRKAQRKRSASAQKSREPNRSVSIMNVNNELITEYFSKMLRVQRILANKGLDRFSKSAESEADLKLMIVTWNLGGIRPHLCEGHLSPLFSKIIQHDPELLIIGFQEIIELKMTMKNIKYLMQGEDMTAPWADIIALNLPKYRFIYSRSLVGLQSFALARKDVARKVTEVDDWLVKLGIMSMGNKGSISFSISLKSQCLSFSNCHLEAGFKDESRQARISNLEDILMDLGSVKQKKKFAYSFIHGDLNFKMTPASRRDVETLVSGKGRFQDLKEFDEWSFILKHANFLNNWKEAEIKFPPTYRYFKGSQMLDSKEGRTPSWTDRVLFREEYSKMEFIEYNSVPVYASDHLPVIFVCRIHP